MVVELKFDLGDKVRVTDPGLGMFANKNTWEVWAVHITKDGVFCELTCDSGYVTLSEDVLEKVA